MSGKQKRGTCIALLLAASLLLSGCSAGQEHVGGEPVLTLPPVSGGYHAPGDNSSLTYQAAVSLYLPTPDGQRLIACPEELSLVRGQSNARTLIMALLSAPAGETSSSLGGRAILELSGIQPIEVSGNVCTVNLATGAMALEYDERYTAALALASTLSEATGIRYVNLLVADRALPFDVSGNLPAGSVSVHPGEELPVLWEQMASRRTPLGESPEQTALSATATLYFPLADGSGFVAETRNLTFRGQGSVQLTEGLLSALSSGAQVVSGTAAMPDLRSLLTGVTESDRPDGTRMITLRFSEELPGILDSMRIDLSCFVACLNWTISTFVPQVGSVRFFFGDTLLSTVTGAAFGHITFEDGITRRAHFRDGLRDYAEIYMLRGERLTRVRRCPTPSAAGSPAAVLALMMRGPTAAEEALGLVSPLPRDLDASDVLAVGLLDDVLLINLSARFADQVRALDENAQRMCCYAMADTLCEMMGVNRVRFFWNGEAMDSLGTSFCWSGDFMLNHSITENSQG